MSHAADDDGFASGEAEAGRHLLRVQALRLRLGGAVAARRLRLLSNATCLTRPHLSYALF